MKRLAFLLHIGMIICGFLQAQDASIPVAGNIQVTPVSANEEDSLPPIELSVDDLAKIPDLRTLFERENQTYSRPYRPSASVIRQLNKDKLDMSAEALAIINRPPPTPVPGYMSLQDTFFVNPLFMPLLFKGEALPKNLSLYNADYLGLKKEPETLFEPDPLFKEWELRDSLQRAVYKHVELTMPFAFRYTVNDFPDEVFKPREIVRDVYEDLPVLVEFDVNVNEIPAPQKFIPDRQYWTSGFESAIQFSQNYISPNWHKGGSSSLNLFTKNYLKYDYKRDKVQLTNELESRVSLFTAPKDTLRDYKIGDDVFRVRSNIGYRAFNKWYYTFDAEFKTQLFNSYQENEHTKQAAILSPFTVTLGLGMKYDLNKTFANKHKNLKLSVNLAPASYSYMYSVNKKIDLGRHGFKQKPDSEEFENVLSQFGSTVRTDLTFNFNRNVSWQSRFYYFTSYDRVVAEFENTLTLAISRYFSTRIYAHIRFDDGATKTEDFDSYFQVNELLSFGFNYKW